MMRIIVGYPPNYRDIVAKFPAARGHGTLFAYGSTICNPSNVKLSPADIAHESAHAKRQQEVGREDWWRRYLAEPQFRFEEEIIAHRAEYACAVERLKGNRLDEYLSMMANRLSGLLYGRMVSRDEAIALITEPQTEGEPA
jgi:hypothetical protein